MTCRIFVMIYIVDVTNAVVFKIIIAIFFMYLNKRLQMSIHVKYGDIEKSKQTSSLP